MSRFGALVRKLRQERNLSLAAVAKGVGSHKGYISGIENNKVNPPSVRVIKRYARFFGVGARELALLAWVDKAPELLQADADRFLKWVQASPKTPAPERELPSGLPPPRT